MTPPATSMRRESPRPSGQALPSDERVNTSDNESGGEKPVREKLRETRIANQAMAEDLTTSPASSASILRRKRSLDDVTHEEDTGEEPGKPGKHPRKRSRSNTPDDKMDSVEDGAPQAISNSSRDRRSLTPELSSGRAGEAHPSGLASPKNKRTRDQVLEDDDGAPTSTNDSLLDTRAADADNKLPGDDRQTKRHRDSGSPEPAAGQGLMKIPPSSGFANTSATSPFGALSSNPAKADTTQTSESKFASSGFGKLASTSSPFVATKGASAFGAAAGTSVFGAAAGTSAFGAGKATSGFASAGAPMQPSAFGSSSGSSAFGGGSTFSGKPSTSVFGGSAATGSVFGGSSFAAAGKPGALGSFAGGSGPKIEGLSGKPSKPFGAAEESDEEPEEEGGDEDGEGHKSPVHTTEETTIKKDKRFYEQEVETGEEGEKTLFTSRAKLFSFEKTDDGSSAWKERGSGFIKINVRDIDTNEEGEKLAGEGTETTDEKLKSPPRKARLIMRANGTNRLVLNTPLTKELTFGQPGTGSKPTGKQIMFPGLLDSTTLQTLQLLMAPDNAKSLWETVQQLREEM